jgi:hypothetical protein
VTEPQASPPPGANTVVTAAPWHRRRRLFLVTLGVASVIVAIPMVVFAIYFGIALREASASGRVSLAAVCPMPPELVAGVEAADLRRRIATLEGAYARRRAMCPICGATTAPPAPGVPEVALVLDTSLSMGLPAEVDAAQESAMSEHEQTGLRTSTPLERSRLNAARQAALAAVHALPADSKVHFFTFHPHRTVDIGDRCQVDERGSFPPAADGALDHAINETRPDAIGTPLADSIRLGAAAIARRSLDSTGKRRPGVVLVVTDGREACGQDPCNAAAQAHAADPELSVIIIDVARNQQAACMVNGRLGKVVTPGDAAKALQALIEAHRQSAAQPAPATAQPAPPAVPACIPPGTPARL